MTAPAGILTDTSEEVALLIACAIRSAADLLRLSLSLRRFSGRCIWIARAVPSTMCSGGSTDTWSIAEEAARRWLAKRSEQERGWVPPSRGRESWLGLMWEVEQLRRAAAFGRAQEPITLPAADGTLARRSDGPGAAIASSTVVMRAGRHYAQFTLAAGARDEIDISVGVIRAGTQHRLRRDSLGDNFTVEDDCFMETYDGSRFPSAPGVDQLSSHVGNRDWEGRQAAKEVGDRIGMLLDLDQGRMTVYKNDERLGVMASGLSGEFLWAVALDYAKDAVRIGPAALPAM